MPATKDRAAFEAVLVPVFQVDAKGDPTVQAVVILKTRMTLSDAKWWARDNGYQQDRIEVHPGSFVIVQRNLDEFDDEGVAGSRTVDVEVENGILLRAGVLKSAIAAESLGSAPGAGAPAAALASDADPGAILMESMDGTAVELGGPILLEDAATAREKFKRNGYIDFRIPIMQPGAVTKNKNRYTEECAAHLERDLSRMLISRTESTKGRLNVARRRSPWPAGVMFASHEPAKRILRGEGEGVESFTAIAARITGTYRESKTLGVRGRTLETQSGKDVAALLLEGLVVGGSLRGIAAEQAPNEWGGMDTERLQIETFGVDFTQNPSMPGADQVTLESDDAAMTDQAGHRQGREAGTKGEPMDPKVVKIESLEDLKALNPALYEEVTKGMADGVSAKAALEAANAKLEAADKATKQARLTNAKSRAKNVSTAWGKSLEKVKGLSPVTRKNLLESSLVEIEGECAALAESNPDINVESETFETAVLSRWEAKGKAKVDALKALLAEELKARHITDAPNLEDTEEAPEGNEGLMEGGAPNLNLLDGRTLLIESENEMVGRPRLANGSRRDAVPAPINDVMLANIYGQPVYETVDSENGRALQHVFESRGAAPGLRNIVREMMAVYETEPFIVSQIPGGSWTYARCRKDPIVNRIFKKMSGRYPLEADEMTTASSLPTLHPGALQGILEFMFAELRITQMAQLVPCSTPQYEVYGAKYERAGKNLFGEISAAAAFATTGDEGAVTRPERLYVLVDTAFDAAETITVTGTNQNGVTITGTVTVPTTAVAGDILPVVASRPNHRWVDVTDAEHTGTASAGKVKFFVFDIPAAADQLTVGGRGKGSVEKITGTTEELSLDAVIPWAFSEDATRALAATGPGAWNPVTETLRLLAGDIGEVIDGRLFYALNQSGNFHAANVVTLDLGSEPASALHRKMTQLSILVNDLANEKPNWLAISDGDVDMMHDIKEDLITRFERRAEAFFQNLSWGRVSRMDVVDCRFQHGDRMIAGSRAHCYYPVYVPLQFVGPRPAPSGQTADVMYARQRSTQVLRKPESRGQLRIINRT
jgi:hypothetical protein